MVKAIDGRHSNVIDCRRPGGYGINGRTGRNGKVLKKYRERQRGRPDAGGGVSSTDGEGVGVRSRTRQSREGHDAARRYGGLTQSDRRCAEGASPGRAGERDGVREGAGGRKGYRKGGSGRPDEEILRKRRRTQVLPV